MSHSGLSQNPASTEHVAQRRPALALKARRAPFRGCPASSQQTIFLHPGYPDKHNILFTLPALDSGGIHHETARIACAILADCRWDGYLSLTRDGERVDESADEILTAAQYYFSVPDDPCYPVVPSFEHFACPTHLPPSWCEAQAPLPRSSIDDVSKRDQTCRITTSSLPIENAHIIPQARSEWWQRNSMFLHANNANLALDTNCSDNTIILRRDLHKMWDDHRFAVIPKTGKWVVQVLWNSPTAELEQEYHNLEMQPLCGVSRYFLFSRFALAILSRSVFLGQSVPRRLVTLTASQDSVMERSIQHMSAHEYRGMFDPSTRSKSRSASPKKRQRSTHTVEDDVTNNEDPVNNESETETETETETESDGEIRRGRPRKRLCERAPASLYGKMWRVKGDVVTSHAFPPGSRDVPTPRMASRPMG